MSGRINYSNPVDLRDSLNESVAAMWQPLTNAKGGLILRDLSPHRTHGTLTGGPTWSTSPTGFPALTFDGSDDYVAIGNAAATHVTKPQQGTLAIWFNHNGAFGTGYTLFVSDDPGYSTNRYGIMVTLGNEAAASKLAAFQFFTGGAVGAGASSRRSKISTVTFPANQWHFFAATWVSSTGSIEIYKNGIRDAGTASGTGTVTGYSATAGRISNASGQTPYLGQIGGAWLSAKVLTPKEVREQYTDWMQQWRRILNREDPTIEYAESGAPPAVTAVPMMMLLGVGA